MHKTSKASVKLNPYTRLSLLFLLLSILSLPNGFAQESSAEESSIHDSDTAFVTVDGIAVFPLRGVSAYPARERADAVHDRIVAFAADESRSLDELEIEHTDDSEAIKFGETILVRIYDSDAEIEDLTRQLLAQIYLNQIKEAITRYRHDRTPEVLWKNAGYALVVILISVVLFWVLKRLFLWLEGLAARHIQRNINELANKSHDLFSGSQVWHLFASLLRLLRLLAIILLAYFLLNTVLGLFPWTRPVALALFGLVLDPIESIARGLFNAVPDLAFLAVLFLVVRYFLKLIRVFFNRVGRGLIKLENFDPDWAIPTFKLLRLLIVAFALVIAYPYIPGSDSVAFKGISVFLGVIFSLGSSSFISGMIAGLTMTYRGAFKEGDLVKIDDTTGVVTDIKLMITRLRTAKNEIVVIPNTNILNANVVNYSSMAREQKLILHTMVGIGYDTPWRQVEALLLGAAERTEGLLKDPPPFVLQKQLGDFAVNYELNAYYSNEQSILLTYSKLHANIQDVFNEFGVQIMSPSYEADPESAKIVPKDRWFAAPAKSPE